MSSSSPPSTGSTGHDRLHGEIGHVPPIEFETEHYRQINPQQQPLLGEPSLY